MSTYDYFPHFAWAVPKAFSSPLAACRFEQGDVLYDTPMAYEGTWAEALPHIKHGVQVKFPERGLPTAGVKGDSDLFSKNWNQRVVLDLTDYKKHETREMTTTEGGLYALLWEGDLKHISSDAPDINAPTTAMKILPQLSASVEFFRNKVASRGGTIFVMPFDSCVDLLMAKFRNVEKALSKAFEVATVFARPTEAGLVSENNFAPTVEVVCFCATGTSSIEVENVLKSAVYTPTEGRLTDKDRFRVSAHGHLQDL